MFGKISIIGVTLLFSSSVFALDLQREELLNLYHGVDDGQTLSSSQMTNGIMANQQANEHAEIKFAPLEEASTTIGVFTTKSLHEDLSSRREYEFKSPTQFGHNESESVGLFIKQTF